MLLPDAVILDLDGVLLDSEQRWNEVREALVRAAGGRWREDASTTMIGMSWPEWSEYLHDDLRVPMAPEEINREVVRRLDASYRRDLPLMPGAASAVRALARQWPLGLASSSNREIIERVLELAGLGESFRATVSSEEVPRGKPNPDVYLEAAGALGVDPERCVGVEDSSNGIRAAAAAGMAVIAVPNAHYPPRRGALSLAAATVPTVREVTPALVEKVAN